MRPIAVHGWAPNPERKWFSKRVSVYYHNYSVDNDFFRTFPRTDGFAGMEDWSRAMRSKSSTALKTLVAGVIEPRRTGIDGYSR